MGRHNRFSTLEQRIKWLLEHQIFLIGKLDKHKIVTAMKQDGLVSKLTYWPDVRIEEAIHQAKLQFYDAEHRRGESV